MLGCASRLVPRCRYKPHAMPYRAASIPQRLKATGLHLATVAWRCRHSNAVRSLPRLFLVGVEWTSGSGIKLTNQFHVPALHLVSRCPPHMHTAPKHETGCAITKALHNELCDGSPGFPRPLDMNM
jgi:hypothetical protein